MQFEDPRFLATAVCLGAICAWFQFPLILSLGLGACLGLCFFPPFVFADVAGFWASYKRSQLIVLWVSLQGRSNIPVKHFWVGLVALLLLGASAALFGQGIAELVVFPQFGIAVADRHPLLPGIILICIYILFKMLTSWARRNQ